MRPLPLRYLKDVLTQTGRTVVLGPRRLRTLKNVLMEGARSINHEIAKKKLRRDIIHYYSSLPKKQVTEEQREVVDYLKQNPVCTFPYTYQNNYHPDNIKVFMDNTLGLHYVFSGEKRLYFKKRWTEGMIRYAYTVLQIEQDANSPHRYLSNEFSVEDQDVIADIGVAEGNFALSVVEKAKRLYLFEADEEWIEALNATFAPWRDKVHIINKFVSDKNDRKNITLDKFFEGHNKIDFLKIDIEGAETGLLKGSKRILSSQGRSKVALCTYHKQNDETVFAEILEGNGFEVSYTRGYMILVWDKNIRAPYLRRGLIRAAKK
jgi:hypothetical protein